MWGCDRETKHPQEGSVIKCPSCGGAAGGCEICGHSAEGMFALHRCPNALLKDDEGTAAMVRYFFRVWEPKGTLPFSGGLWEQSAVFADSMEFLSGAWAAHKNERAERGE